MLTDEQVNIVADEMDAALDGMVVDHDFAGVDDHPDDDECQTCFEPRWHHYHADDPAL